MEKHILRSYINTRLSCDMAHRVLGTATAAQLGRDVGPQDYFCASSPMTTIGEEVASQGLQVRLHPDSRGREAA